MRDDVTARFWAKVDTSGGCWLWLGARLTNGYGRTWVNGHFQYAHRRSWELTHEPIPVGAVICHACDNPPCVRPDHLFLGTQVDNMRDMFAKGRGAGQMRPGAGNPNTRLTVESVRAIRGALAASARPADLARQYDVRPQTIDAIASGKSWKWLDAI